MSPMGENKTGRGSRSPLSFLPITYLTDSMSCKVQKGWRRFSNVAGGRVRVASGQRAGAPPTFGQGNVPARPLLSLPPHRFPHRTPVLLQAHGSVRYVIALFLRPSSSNLPIALAGKTDLFFSFSVHRAVGLFTQKPKPTAALPLLSRPYSVRALPPGCSFRGRTRAAHIWIQHGPNMSAVLHSGFTRRGGA